MGPSSFSSKVAVCERGDICVGHKDERRGLQFLFVCALKVPSLPLRNLGKRRQGRNEGCFDSGSQFAFYGFEWTL